jgi:hypothetical protein
MKMILFHLVWVGPGDVRHGLAPTQVFNAVPSSSLLGAGGTRAPGS